MFCLVDGLTVISQRRTPQIRCNCRAHSNHDIQVVISVILSIIYAAMRIELKLQIPKMGTIIEIRTALIVETLRVL